MSQSDRSIEVPYGWVIIAVSLTIHTIGLAAPTILFVALKPIAADFDWPRAVPSLAYSLLMLGSGIGGVAMGWWMDKRGIMSPVLFGSVMLVCGALLASQADGRWSLYIANGVLIGLLGKAAMIAPLMANATKWFDRRRGLAIAILASGQGLVRFVVASVGWLPERNRGLARHLSVFCDLWCVHNDSVDLAVTPKTTCCHTLANTAGQGAIDRRSANR